MVGVVLLRPSRAGTSGNGPHAAHGPRVAHPCCTGCIVPGRKNTPTPVEVLLYRTRPWQRVTGLERDIGH